MQAHLCVCHVVIDMKNCYVQIKEMVTEGTNDSSTLFVVGADGSEIANVKTHGIGPLVGLVQSMHCRRLSDENIGIPYNIDEIVIATGVVSAADLIIFCDDCRNQKLRSEPQVKQNRNCVIARSL